MRFGVLGSLAVWTTSGEPVTVPELKVRALLADLLVTPNHPVSADRLIDDLWGQNRPTNPAGVLRSKISQLRRVLREAEPDGRTLVTHQRPGYALQVDADAVDAHRFVTLTAMVRQAGHPGAQASTLAEALALWRGPAFADFSDEPFAQATIARLEELRLTALEEYADVRLELGEHHLVVGELADLVSRHPLRERLRALQMRALYRLGRQTDALSSYRDLRDRLRDEFGLDPGPEIVALHQAILKHDPALEVVRGPAPVAGSRITMPAPLTELIGRTGAVTQVCALLAGGRLVTLTGAGGVGKTRLALAVATQQADDCPDGVWLAELAALESPGWSDEPHRNDRRPLDRTSHLAKVAEVVATALGVRDDGAPAHEAAPNSAPWIGRLVNALRSKRALLILDNCERVVEPVAELSDQLLRAAPGVRILATSQEPLRVPGELLHPVPPLDLPDPAATEPPDVQRFSAVRLFVARAASAAPGFAVDHDNAAAIVAICRRLDGIPLALELAATRVRTMGVHQLAAGLDDRFHLLATGSRGAPARQQTLQATISWSWDLLSPVEQAMLRRLSFYSDGCTLPSATAVCGFGEVDRRSVPDLVARLVDRSLVVMVNSQDGPRYRLLESVAAYCLDRLREAGEFDQLQRLHDRYYAALAEEADSHLRASMQREWLRRLDTEAGNLRVALQGMSNRREADLALRLSCSLAWYWVLRGRVGEGSQSLATALAVPGGATAATRATAMTWQAGIAALAGKAPDPIVEARYRSLSSYDDDAEDPSPRARAALLLAVVTPIDVGQPAAADPVNHLLATFRALGDSWGTAAALSVLAYHALLRSDLSAVERNAEPSLALFRELGDQWGVLQATSPLAAMAQIAGDYERAGRLYRDGLRIAQELGLWTEVSRQLNGLGRIAVLDGDYQQAESIYRQVKVLAAEQSVKFMEQEADLGLAVAARRQCQLELSQQYLYPWLEWNRRANWPAGVASILAELGFIAEQRGDVDAALTLHRDGYAAAWSTTNPRMIALALEGVAGAHALAGKYRQSARLLGAAAAARESVGAPLPPPERADVDRTSARVSAALGAEAFRAEFEQGIALRPNQCVDDL